MAPISRPWQRAIIAVSNRKSECVSWVAYSPGQIWFPWVGIIYGRTVFYLLKNTLSYDLRIDEVWKFGFNRQIHAIKT